MAIEDEGEPGDDMASENDEWVTIPGVVVEGYGVASGMSEDSPYPEGTITTQLPFFQELGLDFSSFYPATLNVSIASVLVRAPLSRAHLPAGQVDRPGAGGGFLLCPLPSDPRRQDLSRVRLLPSSRHEARSLS